MTHDWITKDGLSALTDKPYGSNACSLVSAPSVATSSGPTSVCTGHDAEECRCRNDGKRARVVQER